MTSFSVLMARTSATMWTIDLLLMPSLASCLFRLATLLAVIVFTTSCFVIIFLAIFFVC